MGCNIHAYIEYQEGKHWKTQAPAWSQWAHPWVWRNYLLFSLMANVRNDRWADGPVTPVAFPRGFPDDAAFDTRDAYTLLVVDKIDDAHECTREEAERYALHGAAWLTDPNDKYPRISHPDWHTPSWLTTAELVTVQERFAAIAEYDNGHHVGLDAIVAAMRVFDPDLTGKARLVFWFDN